MADKLKSLLKEIDWKSVLPRAIIGVVVVALVAVMLSMASRTGDLDAAQQEEKTPISFTAQVGENNALEKVAENDAYILYANLKDPTIRLERKSDGAVISSRPEGMEEMEDLKNAVRLSMGSMLNIRYADRDSNITEVNSATGSVSRGNFAAKTITDGVRFDFHFANEGFLVPLEITLTEQGLNARVPLADIQESSPSIKLTEILPLPNFGAGLAGTDGYVLVPDGSGAIIPFEYGLANYSQRIYGDDAAVGRSSGESPTKTARLPVFGTTDTKSSVLGIITSGDSRARVAADAASKRTPYTTVRAEFIYRERLLIDVSQATFESTQANMFEPAACQLECFEVQYRMPKTADYVGMANTYRQYLMDEKGMTVSADSSALQVQVIGGVMHEESVLGIPVDRVLPVTSYKDTLSLVEALQERGVDQLSLDYLYWAKNGTESRLTGDMKAESRLGGQSGLKKLLKNLPDGVSLYFDLNFTELMGNQAGYSTLYSTAQNVKKEPLTLQEFYMSTYRPKTDGDKVFMLNPTKLSSLTDKWTKKYTKRWQSAGLTGLSMNGMGSTIYSHFGDDSMDRGSVQALWEQTFADVSAQTEDGLMFNEANAYALPYASTVQSVPVDHSRYLCEERSVPFYTIALHGLVDMSVPPVNDGEGNVRLLQAVESGVGLTYTLGWKNTTQLKNTDGERYNYITADHWLDQAAEQYTQLTPYLKAVCNQAVSAHTQLADGVYRTEFENGAWALVNYTDAAYTADGVEIPANGYLTGGY